MANDEKNLALVVLVHPKTTEKRDKVIALNASYNAFFRTPSTGLCTRSIFTPATRPKAALGMVPSGENTTLLGLVEIFTSKKAFFAIQDSPIYESFHSTVAKEGLFDHKSEMEISQWTSAAGFVARKGEKETPKAGIVMLAKFVLKEKDVDENRKGLVSVLGSFCDWIENNEPGTFTYHVLTSTTNPLEVLLFERYRDLAALGVHGKTPEFKAMFKWTGKFIQGRKTVLSEWEEQEGAFVSNTPGGKGLEAKL